MKMVKKGFMVKFVFTGSNVETMINAVGLSIIEQVGLLENVKRILLERLKKKEEFMVFKPGGKDEH